MICQGDQLRGVKYKSGYSSLDVCFKQVGLSESVSITFLLVYFH